MLTTWYLQESKLGKRERERIVCRCAISDKYEDVPLPFLSKWDEWSSGPVVQSGLTLLYFSISGLDLLGKLDEISAEATIEYIYSFQSPFDGHGGFYGYPKAGALKWFHDLRATYIIYHVSTTIHLVAYVCFVFICCPQKAITDKTYPLNSVFLPRFFVSSVQGPRWTRWTRWSPLSGWLWKSRIGQGEGTGRSGGWQKSLIPKSQNH